MHVTPRFRVDFHFSLRKKPSNEKKKIPNCPGEEVNRIMHFILQLHVAFIVLLIQLTSFSSSSPSKVLSFNE